MIKLADKLYIGKCSHCKHSVQDTVTLIYTCHWPCSRMQNKVCSLDTCPGQENLMHGTENSRSKYLDLANMEIPRYRVEEINQYLDLIDDNLSRGDVYLISENGESRSPSMALLWMAFRGNLISRSSFAAARSDFTRIFPNYIPWPGWTIFFEQEWDALR